MFNIGRICMKIAGRDAGKLGVVIGNPENGYVLIDGEVRRKKVNVKHIQPIDHVVNVKEEASHEDVIAALKDAGYDVKEIHHDSKYEPKKGSKKEEKPTKKSKKKSSKKNKE